MRRRARHDLRQVLEQAHALGVDRDCAQRRGENLDARQREAAYRDPVNRPEKNDALHYPPRGDQLAVGMRGRGARIDVARMRNDQDLGVAEAHFEVFDALEQLVEFAAQRLGIARIEGAGNGRGTE